MNFFILPFSFDPLRLKADLQQITADEWVPHFNTSYYEGEWSGVALRAVGGIANRLYPDPTAQNQFADTPILARCPYFRELLTTLQFPHESVRLLKLRAGSSIREHTDYKLGYEDGFIRLHIPIITDPAVAFFLNGQRLEMNEGECWYLNLNLPHRVENYARIDRVHLVIDGEVNDWLRAIFPSPKTPADNC